ncbi:MAG: ABC transporter permease, partial [Clostridia bacterium]|nr:ABC transporter permease [Clostridia bacterium]
MNGIMDFAARAIIQGTPILFGATGEILTEKSGNLNLGIPGIMYVGMISSVIGGFAYQNTGNINPALAIIIPTLCCLLGSLIVSFIYAFLTITLRANQNVTGLAITTFGVGFGNFFGGSLIKITKSSVPSLSLTKIGRVFTGQTIVPEEAPWYEHLLLPLGFMVYVAAVISIIAAFVLKRTRVGLQLRAVGESPATADAAGVNVTRYKYYATCIGGMIAGLGGLYYIMGYSSGIWSNDAFGDRGWLAIALVIFAIWRPGIAIIGSYIFGGLYVLGSRSNVSTTMIPIMQMLPYVVTIIVLIITSLRKRRETQPPASLGLNY